MSKTARLSVAALLSCLFAVACRCKGGLSGQTESLSSTPNAWDAGVIGIHSAVTKKFVITDTGTAAVNINGVAIASDPRHSFAGFLDGGSVIEPGNSITLTVTYAPTSEGNDDAKAEVSSDNGVLSVEVYGKATDPCLTLVCDAGIGACAGTCQNGACQWPTSGACSDTTQCLSNGQCNGMGGCAGTSDCEKAGAGSCDGNDFVGDLPPGNCDQLTGTCHYTMQTVACDCGCGTQNGQAGCLYNWVPVPGAPAAEVGGVWANPNQPGEVWLSAVNRTGQAQGANFTANDIYKGTGASFTKVGTVANGGNPACYSGTGCGVALTGDGNGNVYAPIDCTNPDNSQSNYCAVGGVWKWNGTSASDENFPNPENFKGGNGPVGDIPVSPVLLLSGTPYALNSDPGGPELTSENPDGSWSLGFKFPTSCSSVGGFWGTGPQDVWLGWTCSQGLYHYDGSSSQKQLSLGAQDQIYALYGSSHSDVWAAGSQRWHYDGTAWTPNGAPPSTQTDTTIWGNGTDYFVGGSYTGLYHYTQNSNQWALECAAPGYGDQSIGAISGANGSFYAAGGIKGLLQRQ